MSIFSLSNNDRNDFRTLFVGGGTGGGLGFMSEQLQSFQAEIVYVDFSVQSTHISQKKIAAMNTSNVIWVKEWMEAIPKLGISHFHLIISTGVLHHLKDPCRGLRIIKTIQTNSGGALLMLYAKYGRSGVYPIQKLLRLLSETRISFKTELKIASQIIHLLPKKTWFNYGGYNDHRMGNIGIYDLLLHKRDMAFSMNTLYRFIEMANYDIVEFGIRDRTILTNVFNIYKNSVPHHRDNRRKQRSVAEMIYGSLKTFNFYVSSDKQAEANFLDEDNLLSMYGSAKGLKDKIRNGYIGHITKNGSYVFAKVYHSTRVDNVHKIADALPTGKHVTNIRLPLSNLSYFFLVNITEEPQTPKRIIDIISYYKIVTTPLAHTDDIMSLVEDIYLRLKNAGLVFLKSKNANSLSRINHGQMTLR